MVARIDVSVALSLLMSEVIFVCPQSEVPELSVVSSIVGLKRERMAGGSHM